jgi:hypothetical protein
MDGEMNAGARREGKTPYFQEERRYSTLTGLHDSFYHGPICHYIDNCLGTSAGHAMAFRRM